MGDRRSGWPYLASAVLPTPSPWQTSLPLLDAEDINTGSRMSGHHCLFFLLSLTTVHAEWRLNELVNYSPWKKPVPALDLSPQPSK